MTRSATAAGWGRSARSKGKAEEMHDRPTWDEYFLEMARVIARRSTCLRRKVGALLVREKRILASGYNGAPSGLPHCEEVGCRRAQLGIPSGERQELCRALHEFPAAHGAEQQLQRRFAKSPALECEVIAFGGERDKLKAIACRGGAQPEARFGAAVRDCRG